MADRIADSDFDLKPGGKLVDATVIFTDLENFTTLSVATMLSELRKYKVGLILAHQYMAQVETEVRDAILGNVGNMVLFRVGPPDARYLHQYFSPEFEELDLMSLPNYNVYLRLMVEGQVSRPFSAETLTPDILARETFHI
jgi:hypothetical protein